MSCAQTRSRPGRRSCPGDRRTMLLSCWYGLCCLRLATTQACRGYMCKASAAAAMACASGLWLMALPSGSAQAQSADLVLCDRVAADPSDPDRPADMRGTPSIAPTDV